MGHFAKVENGIVTSVIVAEKEIVDTGIFGDPIYYVQCSYNTFGGIHYVPNSDRSTPSEDQSKALRKNYPGIGYIYDQNMDAFYEPQPYASWSLNTQTCLWEPPVPYPEDENNSYVWDEETLSWKTIT